MSNTQFLISMKFVGLDAVSPEIKKIDENMKAMGTPIKQIEAQAKSAKRAVDALGSGPSGNKFKWLDDMSNGLQKVSKQLDDLPKKFDKIKSSGFKDLAVGGGLLAPVMTAIKKAGDLQLGMTTIDMASGATQAQDAAIQKAILDASKVTKFSTSEVQALAIKEATSGLTADQVIQLTPEMTKFAEVQNLGKGSSPDEAVTQAISASHMLGIYDPQQLNGFLNNFNKMTFMSPGSTPEFFDTFKYLAPTAKAMGLSNDDILYTSALANRVGMLGSMGGTESADLILRSIPGIFGGMGHTDSKGRFKPSQQLKAMMNLGLAQADGSSVFFDDKGKFKGIQNFIDQLADASKNVNPEEFTKDLKEMFGTQGMRLAEIFSARGGEQLQVIKKQSENMKSIDEFQAAYNKDFKQQLEQFESNVGNLAAKIGTDLLPSATNFLVKLEDGVSVASDWVSSHEKEVVMYGKAAAEVGAFFLAVGTAKLAIGALGSFISPITKMGSSLADLLNTSVITPLKNTLIKKSEQDALAAEKVIRANVVNVYGAEINGGVGGGGIGGGVGGAAAEAEEAVAVSSKSGKLGKVVSVGGKSLIAGGKGLLKGVKAAVPAAIVMGAWDVATAPEGKKVETAVKDSGSVIGGWAGAEAGAAMGAALGSVVPGLGTAIGGVLGGLIGGFAGSALGEHLTSSLYDWIHNKFTLPAPVMSNGDEGINSVSRSIGRQASTPQDHETSKQWQLAQEDQSYSSKPQVNVTVPVTLNLNKGIGGNYDVRSQHELHYGG